jgi:TolB-like protein
MLTGQPPFGGDTLAALVHAVVHDAPAVLTGSAAVAAADRILCRALAKRPDERYPSAEMFAADLRSAQLLGDDVQVAEARRILRLAVLPFRLLRPEPEFEYLGIGLADTLVSSLSGLEALVVRSALRSARYAGAVPDLRAVASELSVDLVVTGSLLRVRDGFRVTAELLTAPAGDSLWRGSLLTSEAEVFDRQDEIVRSVVAALPLTPADRSRAASTHTANHKAYDLYLRGLPLRMESGSWRQARALFEQCLDLDPGFAPAWAERGRLDRVLAKYGEPALMHEAEAALRRALALDPECAAAHHYYAQLDIDLGRLDAAFTRLLGRVRERRAEPQVYAALVQACRYAGLLDESLVAHEQARRLDESVPTSVLHTCYMRGEYERVVDQGHRSSDPIVARALWAMGRTGDAITWAAREEERFAAFPVMRSFTTGHRAALEGRAADAAAAAHQILQSGFTDGEGLFYVAGLLASVDQLPLAAETLSRSIDAGFLCLRAVERDPFLASLRASGAADGILQRLESKRSGVLATFQAEGGRTLLRSA